jgi:hypothetical protein
LGRGRASWQGAGAAMSANKSPTIWPAGSLRAPALRSRISTDSRDQEARQWQNRAPSLGVEPQDEKGTPPPGSNFGKTKLRGPLESTNNSKKGVKTKLSEADGSKRRPGPFAKRHRMPRLILSATWRFLLGRNAGKLQATCKYAVAVSQGVLPREAGGALRAKSCRGRGYNTGLCPADGKEEGKGIFLKHWGKRTHKSRGISNLCKKRRRSEPTEIRHGRAGASLKLHGIRCLRGEFNRRQADVYTGRVRSKRAQTIDSPLLLDFARADAGRARENRPPGAVHQGMNAPQVRLPAPLGDVVGVADPVSERRTFAADFTGVSHC